jgi:hypothetical protein
VTSFFSLNSQYYATGNLKAKSSYGGPTVRIATEVALLSRSITVTGNKFDTISTGPLGMHLMVAYQGVMHITYTRFDTCGQKDLVGRYCVHMHVLGACSDCLVLGNAFEDAWMAAVTIHGTHHSLVTENVFHSLVMKSGFLIEFTLQIHFIR